MSSLVCEHGSLSRKCEICERDDRIKELEASVKEMEEMVGVTHCPECHRNVCGELCAEHSDECPVHRRALRGEEP